jgi:iron complex outermembrane receptor protein
VQQGGIAQSNIVARGFNNAFYGSMLMLQDYRFAGVPSLRVNVPFLFTGTNEDIERMEVLLGPASALYGPNSANGVLHVITKSPFNSQGTTVSIDGGERSILRAGLRHAGATGEKFAYKLSGELMRGNDWEYRDPAEPVTFGNFAPESRRAAASSNSNFPLSFSAGSMRKLCYGSCCANKQEVIRRPHAWASVSTTGSTSVSFSARQDSTSAFTLSISCPDSWALSSCSSILNARIR